MATLKIFTQMVMGIKVSIQKLFTNGYIVSVEFKGQNSSCKAWLNCAWMVNDCTSSMLRIYSTHVRVNCISPLSKTCP